MTSLSFRVRKFSIDANAVAATEFAIVVPFMLLLYVGGVELADGMAINVKVSATAHSVADMVTQNTSLSTASDAEHSDRCDGHRCTVSGDRQQRQLAGDRHGVRNLQRCQWQPDPSMEPVVQRNKLWTGKDQIWQQTGSTQPDSAHIAQRNGGQCEQSQQSKRPGFVHCGRGHVTPIRPISATRSAGP